MAEWTEAENRLFEEALARYDRDRPDYWQNVAREVGGSRSVEEVIRQYECLTRDIDRIEAQGRQNGGTGTGTGTGTGNSRGRSSRGSTSTEQRPRYLNIQ